MPTPTCVNTLVRDEVRLELGGKAAGVAEVGSQVAVGHQVLLHRVLHSEATVTHRTLMVFFLCSATKHSS